MSGKLVSQVYDRLLGHAEQSVLVAMADHANDDGEKCFPSAPLIAWKTGYSDRQVRRVMAGLRDVGALVIVRASTRYHPTEYRIDLSSLPLKPAFRDDNVSVLDDSRPDIAMSARDDNLSGLNGSRPDTRVRPDLTPVSARDDIAVSARPDTAMSYEPSLTVMEPPREPEDEDVAADEDDEQALGNAICHARSLDPMRLSPSERRKTTDLATWCYSKEVTTDEIVAWGAECWRQLRKRLGNPHAMAPTCSQLGEYFAGKLVEEAAQRKERERYAAFVER